MKEEFNLSEKIEEEIEKWWENCKLVIGNKDDKYICIGRKEIDNLKELIRRSKEKRDFKKPENVDISMISSKFLKQRKTILSYFCSYCSNPYNRRFEDDLSINHKEE